LLLLLLLLLVVNQSSYNLLALLTASQDADKKETLEAIFSDRRFTPALHGPTIMSALSDDQIVSLHLLLLAEIRQADLHKLVDFYGNDEVIAILKELISVLYVPLVELYQTADLSTLISDVKDITSSLIHVAEQRSADPRELLNQYHEALKTATEKVYRFFHAATLNDTGTMEGLMRWILGLVELCRRYGHCAILLRYR
jgi:hypothetical protein